MGKGTLICIGVIILVFYFSGQVPHCRIAEEQFCVGDAIYTLGETSEIKEITVIALNVKGTSMIPSLQDNSECLCIKKEKYNVGDIVFFFAEINGQFHGISHRIVAINGEEIITKGDNNNFLDPPMTEESVVCYVPYVPRYRTFI